MNNLICVEWAPFSKLDGVDDEALIAAADSVTAEFLLQQNGFLSRELVKKSEVEYADIIHWKTKADAEAAGANVESCEPCGKYFSLMDMEASTNAGAGFSHYEILRKW